MFTTIINMSHGQYMQYTMPYMQYTMPYKYDTPPRYFCLRLLAVCGLSVIFSMKLDIK